jgi:quercetin dioxygenase-like cupin family protein
MGSTGRRELIHIGQLGITFVLEAAATGGSLSMFELDVPSQARVPWPHSHDAYDETIYGRRGTMTWRVGGDTVQVGAGDVLFIPRGVVHHFHNDGPDASALVVITPGLLGPDYFCEIAAVVAAGGPPDPSAIAAVMRRHGLTPVIEGR